MLRHGAYLPGVWRRWSLAHSVEIIQDFQTKRIKLIEQLSLLFSNSNVSLFNKVHMVILLY